MSGSLGGRSTLPLEKTGGAIDNGDQRRLHLNDWAEMKPVTPCQQTVPVGLSRRGTLRAMAVAGGGLALGVPVLEPGRAMAQAGLPGAPADAFVYWLEISEDNLVTVNIHLAEMGQGIMTSVAMLVAEELEADWSQVRTRAAPNGAAYFNRGYGTPSESTGGSASIRGAFGHSREVGAAAREMLRQAAANRWGVPVPETRAKLSRIHHEPTGRAFTYGELAADAAMLEPPPDILLKPKSQWTLIGTSLKRVDTPAKVDGSAVYGTDVHLDGLRVAVIRHCPSYDGALMSVDPQPALAIKGVEHVIPLENAVAVIADGYWPAHKGLEALTPEWDLGPRRSYDMSDLEDDLAAGLARTDAPVIREDGDVHAAFEYASDTVEQTFDAPYLTHVCMEPMNATAWVRDGRADIWFPGQGHTIVVDDVSAALGLDKSAVHVHRTFLGGGFGRRGESDVAVQAARLSAVAGGIPVKLLWSREEDVRRDFFRPAARTRIRVALADTGLPTAMDILAASPSINIRRFPAFIKDGKDPGAFSGFTDSPYPLDHHRFSYAMVENGVPVGYWRSVGHSQNVFFREAMINELAERAGLDGLSYRKAWLAADPRLVSFLEELDAFSGYASPPHDGLYRGIALNASHGSICGHVVHVTTRGRDGFKVERIDCVVDPGVAVNPDGVIAQVESQAHDGLSAALFGQIRIANGGAADSNFDTVRMMRLAEAPDVRVRIREWESASPGGMGEPALPSVAPALTDAIYQATGRRLRSLPIVRHGFDVIGA